MGIAAVRADADIGERASEFWVDGGADVQPGSDPSFPDATIDHSGQSLFVWKTSIGGTGNDIYLRRFGTDLAPLANPAPINTFTAGDQRYPRIALGPDDTFMVIWQSAEPDPNVMVNRQWVRGQAFAANGSAVGGELLISTYSTGQASDISADVAAPGGGGFVVVWQSRPADGSTSGGAINILGRRYSSAGAALSEPFVVNSAEGITESDPAITELADGGFLVVWANPDAIQGRRFMPDGTPVGNDFRIDTFDSGRASNPDAVLHADGRVLVVWEDEAPGNVDQIRGRLYSNALAAIGNDFVLSDLVTDSQVSPRAGDYGKGGFFVVWESSSSVGNDADSRSIQGRVVSGANQFSGGQFQVNLWTTGAQQFPGIGGRDDRVAIDWHSKSNADTSNNVINGQLWAVCGIFCDSFEGGVP